MAAFSIVHLLSAEFIPSQRSKGEVLLFRRRQASKNCHVTDVEKPHHDIVFVHDLTVSNSKSFGAFDQRQGQASPASDTTRTQSSVLHWKGLSYEIKNHESEILTDINGWVKPGTLTALMVKQSSSYVLSAKLVSNVNGRE